MAGIRAYVDTSRHTLVAGGTGAPVMKLSGTPAVVKETGEVYWAVSLSVFTPGEEVPQVWKVKVPGEPKGLVQGQPVKVTNLVLADWEIDDKHGIAFKAESIVPLAAGGKSAA